MTDSHTDDAAGTWSVPQCPFAIEYSLRVLDDIRLAVMDAFFSLPRCGAEFGGVLIGKIAQGRIIVSDHVALDCEHAYGPSFQISPRDEAKLEELLGAFGHSNAVVPVGWYHSHTRSEIFLSEADLAIHKRFFPERWQIALVMKPHTFQPMRCGFFFQEPGGTIQAASTYQEFTLDPLPMRPIPSGGVPLPTDTAHPGRAEAEGTGQTITVEANRVETPAAPAVVETPPAPEPESKPAQVEPPQLLMQPEEKRSWGWVKVLVAVMIGVSIGLGAFWYRQLWWPKMSALFTPNAEPANTFAPIGLATTDTEGQLQIHWDRFSPAVRQALGGRLTINDVGPLPKEIKLDPITLQAGNFTYVREGESVTVAMVLDEPNGRQAQGLSTFLGKLPAPAKTADNPEIRKQRDALAQESGRLRTELAAEVEKNRKLQKQLDDARTQLREQARKRLAAQAPK